MWLTGQTENDGLIYRILIICVQEQPERFLVCPVSLPDLHDVQLHRGPGDSSTAGNSGAESLLHHQGGEADQRDFTERSHQEVVLQPRPGHHHQPRQPHLVSLPSLWAGENILHGAGLVRPGCVVCRPASFLVPSFYLYYYVPLYQLPLLLFLLCQTRVMTGTDIIIGQLIFAF